MNDRRPPLHLQTGFSTLELLVAFAILTLSLTAVIMVAFGNQTYAIDTTLSQRALYLAESNLETSLAGAMRDLDDLRGTYKESGNFTEEVSIVDISECAKRIDSTISWKKGRRELDTTLSSIITDSAAASFLKNDCAVAEPAGTWDVASAVLTEDIAGQSHVTAIDEFDHFIYLATSITDPDEDDLFVYEFDGAAVALRKRSAINTSPDFNVGLYDLDVAGRYAFVASASSSHQLQVIDIGDPESPSVLWLINLPGVNPAGSFPEGRAVYFYDDRVYVGTRETGGPEFHVFDVSADLALHPPVHLGSLELSHTIRDIVVSGDYAYLATTDNQRELMLIDIAEPTSMIHPDVSNLGFNAPGNHDGSAVYVGADKVYLGRKQGNPPTDSFYILDKTAVRDSASDIDGVLGEHNIGLANNASVTDIRLAGELAFLSLDDRNIGLAVYEITDPLDIVLSSPCAAPDLATNAVGLDLDASASYLFLVSRQDPALQVFSDTATCTP